MPRRYWVRPDGSIVEVQRLENHFELSVLNRLGMPPTSDAWQVYQAGNVRVTTGIGIVPWISGTPEAIENAKPYLVLPQQEHINVVLILEPGDEDFNLNTHTYTYNEFLERDMREEAQRTRMFPGTAVHRRPVRAYRRSR